MKNAKGKTVEEITAKLNPQQEKIAHELRSLTKKTLHEVTLKL